MTKEAYINGLIASHYKIDIKNDNENNLILITVSKKGFSATEEVEPWMFTSCMSDELITLKIKKLVKDVSIQIFEAAIKEKEIE